MIYLRTEKNIIRAELLEKRREFSPSAKTAAEEKMCRAFMSLVSFRYAGTVLLYAPLKYELDLLPIAVAAWDKGKRVAFPRCDKDSLTMTFHYISSFDELSRGAYGIYEPSAGAELYQPEESSHDVCIVPAIAFDRYGYRIGYGKGYYDRFLPRFKGGKAGFTMSGLLQDRLPRGKYDTVVNILVTEKGVRTPYED